MNMPIWICLYEFMPLRSTQVSCYIAQLFHYQLIFIPSSHNILKLTSVNNKWLIITFQLCFVIISNVSTLTWNYMSIQIPARNPLQVVHLPLKARQCLNHIMFWKQLSKDLGLFVAQLRSWADNRELKNGSHTL